MNQNYLRSRSRETKLKHELEKEGYFVVRAAGSKGFADLVAIKPTECGIPSHFEVRFIQIKVSVNLKNEIKTYQICTAPFGDVNVELLKFPVKVKSWYAKRRRVQKNKL